MIHKPIIPFSFAAALSLTISAIAQQVATFDELTPLYPDTAVAEDSLNFSSHVPKNGKAVLHVLIKRLANNNAVEISTPNESIQAAELHPVSVTQNTGLHFRTELYHGTHNPHVIRRAPFEIYDAIQPVEKNTANSDNNGTLALRFELDIPNNAPAGEKAQTITLSSGEWKRDITWNIQTAETTAPSHDIGYTNWFSVSNFAKFHDCKMWSDEHWALLKQSAELMHDEGQNMFWVPWGYFMKIDDSLKLTVDEQKLDRYTQLFLDEGFTKVELGHLATRENGEWTAKHLVTQLGKKRVTSEEGKKILTQQLAAIKAYAKRHDFEGNLWQHISDEPLSAHAADYVAVAKMVHELLPEAPVFDATHCTTELVGAVDVWCPQLDIYYEHRDFFQERIKAGEQVWLYTCLSPGGRALNRLLDQERTRQVLLKWLIVKDDLSGYLHWGLNHYRKNFDPYRVTSPQFDDLTGPSRNFLPPGDSHVVYPSADKKTVLSSVRINAHRLGLEDAAMLIALQEKDAAKTDVILSQLIKAPREHVLGTSEYRTARSELLNAISKTN